MTSPLDTALLWLKNGTYIELENKRLNHEYINGLQMKQLKSINAFLKQENISVTSPESAKAAVVKIESPRQLPTSLQTTPVQALGQGQGRSGIVPTVGADGTRIEPLQRAPISDINTAIGPKNTVPTLLESSPRAVPTNTPTFGYKRVGGSKRQNDELLTVNTPLPLSELEVASQRSTKFATKEGTPSPNEIVRNNIQPQEPLPADEPIEEDPEPIEEDPPENQVDEGVPENPGSTENPLGSSTSVSLDPALQGVPLEGEPLVAPEETTQQNVPLESGSLPTNATTLNINLNGIGVKTDAQPMVTSTAQQELQEQVKQIQEQLKQVLEEKADFIRKEKELIASQVAAAHSVASINPHEEELLAIEGEKQAILSRIAAEKKKKEFDAELLAKKQELERLKHPDYFLPNQNGDTPMLEGDRLESIQRQHQADLAELTRLNNENIEKILEAVQSKKEKASAEQQTEDKVKSIREQEKEATRKAELANEDKLRETKRDAEDKVRQSNEKEKETKRLHDLYIERQKEREKEVAEKQKAREADMISKHTQETARRQKDTEDEQAKVSLILKLEKKFEEELKKKQALFDEQAYKFNSYEQKAKDAELIHSYEKRIEDLKAEKDSQVQIRALRDEFNSKEEKRQAAELAELKQKLSSPYSRYRDQYGNGESGPPSKRHKHSQTFFDVINSIKDSKTPEEIVGITSKKRISKTKAKKRLKKTLKKFGL